ncbi:TRAP transporter small permease [Pikeienuella sp. HZG-20]|uniref:TRAP transporter small permease n=1 Tax=Paludibacillus litoralis TaxID=3133267 RepID=UPI0030EEC582
MTSQTRRARLSVELNRAVEIFCVICVLVMLSISFVGFFYMIATGSALSWTYSLARLFIPWVGLMSVTVAFFRGEHIAMGALATALPAPLTRALRVVNVLLVGAYSLLMIWYGGKFLINASDTYMVSDQIQIHSAWVVASVPASGLVVLVHLLCGADLLTMADYSEDPDVSSNA